MTAATINLDSLTHKRILASAGSGKTFQLTNRYLTLVAAGAEPGSILASTFTRAAAGEIRNRILMRLAQAVDDDKERRELAMFIGRATLTRAETLGLLANLARNVNRMNVRTLDSFFASVVSAFSMELGIPPGSEIISDARNAQLRLEAIRLMLDERDPQALVDLLRQLTRGDSDRSVVRVIDEAVTGLYELYRETQPEAWEQVPLLPTLSPVALEAAIQRLAEVEISPDRKRFLTARATDVSRCYERDWETFITKGIAAKIAGGEMLFYRVEIDEILIEAYTPIIAHAQGVLVGRIRRQTIATRDMLALYHEQYRRLKHRQRVMTFADFTCAMQEAQRLGTLDVICYRIDASLQHLLLDEFQDTSVQQWAALRPFITEIVGNLPPDHTFFCVGDVKQSIYGWRDAAPDVLEHMPDLIPGADESTIVLETLSKSYRSSPVLMQTLNAVFGSLPENPALKEQPEVSETWAEWYAPHETAKDLAGYAELRLAPQGRGAEEKDRLRFVLAADLVEDLHRRNPNISIAVLTRTNDAVAYLLHEFNQRGIHASGRGGGPLTDSPPVNAILDLLQLADHPGDTVAAFHVAHSPLAAVVGAKTDLAERKRGRDREQLARKVRRTLLERGYAPTISRWVQALVPATDERQLRRLVQLVELAEQFDASGSLRPGDFLEVVETTNVVESRPASVQVMTVHQSKGLEFDAVVLPELESAFTGGSTPTVVFERPGAAGEITRICRYMNQKLQQLAPELAPLFDQHTYRTVRESLCVLYVAMTRARQGLYMIIDPPKDNERTLPKKISSLLRCALAGESLEPNRIVYAHGDESWLDTDSEPVTPVEIPRHIDRIELASGERTPRFGMVAPPASMHTESTPLAEQLRLRDDEASDRGTVIHGLFEQIEWIEDWEPDETMLLEIARYLAPHREELWLLTCVEEFMTMTKRPGVREVLSRGNRDPDRLRIWRELPFARIIEGRVQQGRIDRLVAELDVSGTPQRATVIDFKTDRIVREHAVSEAERYRDQLESYRHPAARRIGLEVEAVSTIILFLTADIAVTVG